ncbi:MAG: ABC transporter ATP-binding protein, partial [Spirochaetaceae bacterium]|nr:ABC transporter ATP-binding protein [Spirochaetaceae bacterium]
MFGGGGGRGGMGYLLRHGDEQARPQVSRALLRRVLAYARPYAGRIILLFTSICSTIGLGLLTPLIVRDLIDTALPAKDAARLNLLAAGLIAIPVAGAVIRIWQRKLDATIGSGIILDLRTALYSHLQRMSMRFFTSNKTGELMSRLNSDVIGAQSAVTNTLVDVTTNLIQVAGTLAIMLALEWRLTVLGLAVLPIFLLLGRRFGKALREVSRQSMERNARMNAIMSETLNISGLVLVKLFGRRQEEQRRFGEQAEGVRHLAIRQAVIGSRFFVLMGIATAVGTAGIYLVGGHLHIRGGLTIGTVVAFSTYLAQLYGPLRSLSNVAVVVAQSLVSFERVFEVLDLPVDIEESPHAQRLERAEGRLEFREVSFRYERDDQLLLTEARRAARVEDMAFTASGG